MASYDANPFAGDTENPFADPSVASVTSNAARGLEDFNPFADQNTSQATGSTKTTPMPPPPQRPAAQPAVLQTKEEPPSYVIEEEQANLARRQEDLERKAAELQRKEQELQRMQFGGYRENNFPPCPAGCRGPCRPCFFHDISIDIPIEHQKVCKGLFFRWQMYSLVLFFNFLSAFALLVDDDDPLHEGQTFALSLLYLVANIPLSFLCWYRPAYNALKEASKTTNVVLPSTNIWTYAVGGIVLCLLNWEWGSQCYLPSIKAYCVVLFINFISAMALMIHGTDDGAKDGSTFGLSALYLVANIPLSFIGWYRPCYRAFKNDSSFSYVIFFLVFFLHIGVNIFYVLGVPGGGTCGFINATTAIHHSVAVGGMMFVTAALLLIGVIVDIFLLIKVHRIYRMAGASFEKAQTEFARGVATNQQVQNAAAEVAATGVRNAMAGENRK